MFDALQSCLARRVKTGWAIAEAVAANGFHVTVSARSRPAMEVLAAKIGGTAIVCDATVERDVESMLDAVVRVRGRIDSAVLVAGAGVPGYIDSISDADLQHAFALNFYAPVYFLRHVARRMRDGGSIVLMTSIAASKPWPGYFAYGSAKVVRGRSCACVAAQRLTAPIRRRAEVPGSANPGQTAGHGLKT